MPINQSRYLCVEGEERFRRYTCGARTAGNPAYFGTALSRKKFGGRKKGAARPAMCKERASHQRGNEGSSHLLGNERPHSEIGASDAAEGGRGGKVPSRHQGEKSR